MYCSLSARRESFLFLMVKRLSTRPRRRKLNHITPQLFDKVKRRCDKNPDGGSKNRSLCACTHTHTHTAHLHTYLRENCTQKKHVLYENTGYVHKVLKKKRFLKHISAEMHVIERNIIWRRNSHNAAAAKIWKSYRTVLRRPVFRGLFIVSEINFRKIWKRLVYWVTRRSVLTRKNSVSEEMSRA